MTVRYEVADHVATITLDAPERHNTLTHDLLADLAEAWVEARDDDAVRAIVLTGAGEKAFCAGAHITDLLGRPETLNDLWNPNHDPRPDRGIEMWKPAVAAVNGYCLGGGMTLMLATDIRVAAETATFAMPEVRWGILASCGGTQRLMRELTTARAMEMLLVGEPISADRALEWGLINRVVPADQVLDTALEYAAKIAANAPLAVRATKELARRSWDMDLDSGLRLEDMVVRVLQESDDFAEGLRAFKERRSPRYEGK